MHADCSLCRNSTRATAYDRLGQPHSIPATHGANWLGGDLRRVLGDLELGEELVLDYRGSIADAPRIAIERSMADTITAQGPDGWRDVPGRSRWTWPRSAEPEDRRERITFALLAFLTKCRGASRLILVPPADPTDAARRSEDVDDAR